MAIVKSVLSNVGRGMLIEWALVASVVSVAVAAGEREMRVLQGEAELSAIKTTLGALRTAFIIDHLHRMVQGRAEPLPVPSGNPFALLERRPPNYFGEVTQMQTGAAPPGSWVFDADCVCVGYLPLYPEWLVSRSGDEMLWFRTLGPSEPLQLKAMDAYAWQGKVLD